MKKILVTGALGQIGTELTSILRAKYGNENVIASDIRPAAEDAFENGGPFVIADCTDPGQIAQPVKKHKIDAIFHLAAILSAKAEKNPQQAWHVNMTGLYNVLEVARESNCKMFTPSSIGAFGPSTPADQTPQDTIQRPNTMYGVTKVAGELLCDYYFKRFGIDTRGVRYPGLISYKALPGGGTTDYAVEIYYEAIRHKKYTCYLAEDTCLDLLYMPDAIDAAIGLMEADGSKLTHRNAFNVTSMSVAPPDIAREIKKSIPDFSIDYQVDPVRQRIADSWPNSIDDRAAREEWGWQPSHDLTSMTEDMLKNLAVKLKKSI